MVRPSLEFDPYDNDPARWGVSMAQLGEVMLACLDAAAARSVAEVGAYAGDLTRVLVAWAARTGAHVQAIDPAPQPPLEALAAERPELELIRETSLDALPTLPLPDAIVIDGDHNYYTVFQELKLVSGRAGGDALPLLFFHDVLWPHGRRDDYFDPETIPAEARHPVVGAGSGLYPGDAGNRPSGLPYPRSAAHEGGPRNGVLTAIEDFLGGEEAVRFALIPAFFGFGVAWDERAHYARAVAAIVEPLDRHPVFERLEANRIEHLARAYALQSRVWDLERRITRQEAVLRRQLESSAFSLAERLSRLRIGLGIAPAQSVVGKDEVRRALGQD